VIDCNFVVASLMPRNVMTMPALEHRREKLEQATMTQLLAAQAVLVRLHDVPAGEAALRRVAPALQDKDAVDEAVRWLDKTARDESRAALRRLRSLPRSASRAVLSSISARRLRPLHPAAAVIGVSRLPKHRHPERMAVAQGDAFRHRYPQRSFAMYFGTLVTSARDDRENATWQRDMDASRVVAPGRWRAFWRTLVRRFA
jgi:hypothetical protein